ncbi:hypothetical protein, partial [uncultured Rikenella sp.]|uniref:hypothetical protein n=1 Tax=uncultured Rikenella sp. TaxID=368003 RepID=UPI00261D7EE3
MGVSTPKRRPLGFHLDFANAKRVKSLFKRAGDGFLRGIELFRAPAQFIYIRLPPKSLNRFFRRGARLSDRRVLPLRRA